VVSSALVGASALVPAATFPRVPLAAWGGIHAVAAFALIYFGRYDGLLRIMKWFIGLKFAAVVSATLLILFWSGADWNGLRNRSEFSLAYTLSLIGGVGGTVILLSYGYQMRRLVAQAVSIAQQTICTTHSPRVASFFPATSVQILEHRADGVASTPMLASPLKNSASNALRKLCRDERPRVVEGLMQHRVLVPEGRSEYEWFRLLADLLETAAPTVALVESDTPAFGTVVGVIPTHDSAVTETYRVLRRLRGGLVPLIDGDDVGDATVLELLAEEPCPRIILQWRKGWTTEDGIGWILKADEKGAVDALSPRIEHAFQTMDDLVSLFKVKTGPGRLKVNYLAYEEVASVVGTFAACRQRAATLTEAVTRACLEQHDGCELLVLDEERSSEHCTVLRMTP
jgi:hypothetical protein